jgi:hypothetical protein
MRGRKPSFIVFSLVLPPKRPVRQGPPRFDASGRRKAHAVFRSCGQKNTALPFRSAIMPVFSEVASYDFRP